MKKILLFMILLLSSCSAPSENETIDLDTEVVDEQITVEPDSVIEEDIPVEEVVNTLYKVNYEIYLNDKVNTHFNNSIADIADTNELDLKIFDKDGYLDELYISTPTLSYVPYKNLIYDGTDSYLGLKVTYEGDEYYAYYLNEKVTYAKVDERYRIINKVALSPTANNYLWLENYTPNKNQRLGVYEYQDIVDLLDSKTYIDNDKLILSEDVFIDVYYSEVEAASKTPTFSQTDSQVKKITLDKLEERYNFANFIYVKDNTLYNGTNEYKSNIKTETLTISSSAYAINTGTDVFYMFSPNDEVEIEVKIKDGNKTVKDVDSYILNQVSNLEEGESKEFDFVIFYSVKIDDYEYSSSFRKSFVVYR